MKATFEDKLTMYSTVSDYLNNNSIVWSPITAISTAKADFETAVSSIRQALQTQVIPTKGTTLDKLAAKQQLAVNCEVVSNLIHSYASQQEDNNLAQQMNYPLSVLEKMRDSVLVETADNIIAAATDNLPNMADFGLTNTTISNLTTKRNTFNTHYTKPRLAIVNRKTQTDQFNKLYKKVDNILKNRLDNLLSQFSITNPNFYKDYLNARIIINTQSSQVKPPLATFQDVIAALAIINLGVLPKGAAKLKITIINGGPLEIGLSIDGTTFNGNTITIGGIGNEMILIKDLTSIGSLILLRSQNETGITSYKVEVFG